MAYLYPDFYAFQDINRCFIYAGQYISFIAAAFILAWFPLRCKMDLDDPFTHCHLSVYPKFSPFFSERNKRLWSYYLAIATLIVLFFFGADFGNFSYNHTRINASALNFAEDPVISFKMLWQSYPMVWI